MDPLWVVAAFAFGAVSSRIGLPPLVGYLLAGFFLNTIGVQGGAALEEIANAGVTLLLFTIGLKLKLKSLSRPEVWAGSGLHMITTVAVFSAGIKLLGILGLSFFSRLDWQAVLLVAFALSFSSTVFAVKVFDGKNEMPSRHATTAIGILIMQDILAVVFLALSTGKIPSPWAVVLLAGLLLIRPLAGKFMARCGHGELLMLFGIVMTVAGFASFEHVGMKGDLGALVFGMLLANHTKAEELANRLLGFKDLFLVAFFLSIGMSGSPSLVSLWVAVLLATAVPFKAGLFFIVLTRFKLRARTSLLTSLSLANYSEFGLIVGAIGVANGWIEGDWLITIALALSISFIAAAPLNSAAHSLYARFSTVLRRLETADRLPEDRSVNTGSATIGVVGMGGVGTAAYDEMRRRHGEVVIGMDFCADTVGRHQQSGRNVVHADADDSDFWERFEPAQSSIRLVMLALPDPNASVFAIRQLQSQGYQGQIAASVRYEDQIEILKAAGIDAAYSLYEEAGVGFADHVCSHMDHRHIQDAGLTF